MHYKYIIIGGGFFGCYFVLQLKLKKNATVIIIEREKELLQRASYNNQARVHNGYHYPRSILTGLSSSANFQKFVAEFDKCIFSEFEKYYAIGKIGSKVTASQYVTFCKRVNIPLYPAPKKIETLFNDRLISATFAVKEFAFDAVKLKNILHNKLKEMEIPILFATEANSITSSKQPEYKLQLNAHDRFNKNDFSIHGKYIFNCTYSNINTILQKSNLAKIHLKQELTEMALVKMPDILANIGVTVMCGPFFSFMPFPLRSAHTLSHVRYTPHYYWYDRDVNFNNQHHFNNLSQKTNFIKMLQDVKRYIPAIAECKYLDSLWEIKTVLPQSELDDGRPILYKKDAGLKNFICIMGGKIDNIYDLEKEIANLD